MGDILQQHGPGTSAHLFGCECEVCGPWETVKRPNQDFKDLSAVEVDRAKRLVEIVAERLPAGATAGMFRRAARDSSTVMAKRLLLAIHVIRNQS